MKSLLNEDMNPMKGMAAQIRNEEGINDSHECLNELLEKMQK